MALTTTQVSQLYVSILNRASEGSGNTFWQTSNVDMISTANAMLASPDAISYLGALTNEQFINTLYANTLNKTPTDDPTGIAYWTAELDGGKSRGEVTTAIITSVNDPASLALPGGQDAADQFNNRVTVSDYTAANLTTAPTNYAISLQFLAGTTTGTLVVTKDVATIASAEVTVLTLVPETFTLTTGIDSGAAFTGNAGDDVYTASVLTANPGDELDGAGGTGDTLNVETAANIGSTFIAKNIEIINLNALGAVTVDATNMAEATAFNSNDAAGAVTVNSIANTSATYGVKGAATNNLTLNYATAVLNGSADKLMVNLNGSTATTVDADSGFESVEVNTTAASTLTSLVAPTATALTLSGDATLTLVAGAVDTFTDYTITNTAAVTYNDIASVKTFVASSNTGGIVGADLTAGLGLDATTTADVLTFSTVGSLVQTGSGADNINVNTAALFSTGSAIIKLGAGNDILNLSAASSSGEYIYGEAGDDFIYLGGNLTAIDLIDGGADTDTIAFASGATTSLIARGIENVQVGSATNVTDSVTFTSIDSAVAIADSGAGATTFANLTAGSSYTSSVKKAAATDDVTLGFATSSAATLDVQLTKGTTGDVTLTQVADATVTLGAASTMTTGISLDSAATKLTVNATGAVDLSDILAGTAGNTTTVEKLASIAVTGDLGVTITTIANDKSLATLDVKSTATTTNTGDVTVGAVNSDVAVTSINVSSAGGSAAIGAIDAANAAFTGGLTTLTVSGVDTVTASSVTSITADDLATATVTNTGANSTIGAITATGSTTDFTDGAIGTITVSGGTGASSTGNIAADNIGTVTVTGTGLASTATIGAVTVLGAAATTDGTVTALKASSVGAATIGAIAADSVGSILVESTSTTVAALASIGTITDGGTGAFATLGSIDITSAAGSVQTGVITADAMGNFTLSGVTTATVANIDVSDASNASVTGNISITAGTNLVGDDIVVD
ncbi:MAG TPA: DUF4214 domain-containing protein, partial [Methyloprofundus sp.]|nr:DUF4214 domain-containing protein [Methyloprofundus sp.]